MIEKVMSKYKDDILADLKKLVAIESVAEPDCHEAGTPFGAKSAEALGFMTDLAGRMGFSTENCDNYACHAQLGSGGDEDYAAVLCHVDVVPTGDGWSTDPLELTEKDGYLYGRGVADDKGAALISLYCMKAMRDNGVPMKRPIRCIFGGGEEIGMDDMGHYFSKHALPTFAFTPDADYPACNCEKGILHLQFTGRTDPAILSIKGGSAINCVADSCTAVISCDEAAAGSISALINAGAAECAVTSAENGFRFAVKGTSAHAMCPEKGVNAINCLLTACKKAGILSKGSAETFFSAKVCTDTKYRRFFLAAHGNQNHVGSLVVIHAAVLIGRHNQHARRRKKPDHSVIGHGESFGGHSDQIMKKRSDTAHHDTDEQSAQTPLEEGREMCHAVTEFFL